MTRQRFLKTIRKKLKGLPAEEVENSLAFYDEAISDRMDNGMTEEEAIAALGSADEIAARIIDETPEADAGENRSRQGGFAILPMILTSPIWFAALIVMAAVIPVAAACMIALAAVLAAVAVALPVCAVVLLAACVVLFCTNRWAGILALGGAMVLAGASILVWKSVWPLARWLARCCECACRVCVRGLSSVWKRICGRKG